MKTTVCLLFSLVSAALAAQSVARVATVSLESAALNQTREILVYTPVDYDRRVHEYFDVIYVFDSQNREFFDYVTAMTSFSSDGKPRFIVVGITSPYDDSLDYARNNDLLPVLRTDSARDRFGKYSGNADAFLTYVADEVAPYVDSTYRTLDHPLAVGHSLGASFLLYAFAQRPNLFRSYIAVSPNLAYDGERIAEELLTFDYSRIERPTFLYLSHANEGQGYWQEWVPARERVYAFLRDSLDADDLTVEIGRYPDNDHWNTFPPSFDDALSFFNEHVAGDQAEELSSDVYDLTLRVRVPTAADTLYVAGNQASLGNWEPSRVALAKVSALEREITLPVRSPAVFKLTRGSWDTEAEVAGTHGNVIVLPRESGDVALEVVGYYDRYE